MDVIHTIKYVKTFKRYDDNITEVIGHIVEKLEVSSIGFIAVHIGVLFMVSFIVWVYSLS